MLYRKYIFLALLFGLLFMGCAQQDTCRTYEQSSHGVSEFGIESDFEPGEEYVAETVSFNEPNGVLTLGQVLALTLMNNPELKVFSLKIRAAQARKLQAGLWPNPELNVEVEEVGGTGERRGFDAAETTIQLKQLIELGDKSGKRKKVASFEEELASIDYQNKRLEVFSEAAKAFVSVLKAQEKVRLSNEILNLSAESLETVEKRVNAGKDSPLQQTRSSVAHSNIKIKHRETQRNLEFSRKKLAFFWEQDGPQFERVTGNLDDIGEIGELEELINRLKLSPGYVRWETEIKKSQATLDLEKSRAFGDVKIGAGLQRFNETGDNAFVFGVTIPLPISNRNQGATQEAVYNIARARQEQKAGWLKLQNDFNQAYEKLANTHSRAMALKSEVLPGALEVFNASTIAYSQGKADYLNVLDAQRTLFEVRNSYIESLAAYHTARIDIERFTGKVNETVSILESE
ncbi:MAG: TolC family protein [Planctomycetota bacterium]